MYLSPPVRSRQSYRHEAFIWRDQAHFRKKMVPFVEDGIAAGEPVLVAVIDEHAEWLRDGLGADQSSLVTFVDMADLGRNPARIIPAWQEFLDGQTTVGRPARGIEEPIWAGRRDEEIQECQLHEALLNVALKPHTPFWLVCPYDAGHLPEPVLVEAERSHPAILDADSYRGSTTYGGGPHVELLFSAGLPELPTPTTAHSFTAETLAEVFALVVADACTADLWSHQALNLAEAARRLAEGSLRRGASGGVVRLWDQPHALVCEVSDTTVVEDVLAGRRPLARDRDHGLWSVNEVCDLVQMRSSPHGTTVRLHIWK